MKILKPKKIPGKMIKVLYDTYLWGYNTSQDGEIPIDFEELTEKYKKK